MIGTIEEALQLMEEVRLIKYQKRPLVLIHLLLLWPDCDIVKNKSF